MNWSSINKVYFIGIKGVGMTMLAQYLSNLGIKISGSDTTDVFMTDEVLKSIGAEVKVGFKTENIDTEAQVIIYSSAYNETNVEVASAKASNKKVLVYAEALADVFNQTQGIAVSGSHGKTTTTAWLGFVLNEADLSPSVLVGARVPQFNGAGLFGKSNILVAEADEYQNKLALLNPKIILLNNIDYDHPDFYPTPDSYKQAFIDFVKKLSAKGILVANFDDEAVKKISTETQGRVVSYGINSEANYQAKDIVYHHGRQYFKVFMEGEDLGEFNIGLLGVHNISNALAVIATNLELGADLLAVRNAVAKFIGTSRRWEKLGEYKGALIYDDYAHHPTEIKATIVAARQQYGDKKIIVVFSPHTFSRTEALMQDFAKSWEGVDELVILSIYASARETHGNVSSEDLIAQIKIAQPSLNINYQATADLAEIYLKEHIKGDELVILMGASDVFRIGEKLIA
jgi:UDP-N-acetylmuramate--alanine ligase